MKELGGPPKEKPARRIVSETRSSEIDRVLDLRAIRAEKANRNLHDFIKEAWHIVEPKRPFVTNWHVEAICDALEAVALSQIQNLIINVPPRTSKSTISTIMFQPWCWTKWPHLRWLNASYSAELSMRHSSQARRIMMSQWYRRYFGDKFDITNGAIKEIENSAAGYRLTTSVDGMATGRGGDIIVVDDPHNVKEGHSDVKLRNVRTWYDGTMSNRAEGDVRDLRRILIMQRVHDNDLSGHLLRNGGYVHLCLPMEYNPKARCVVPEIDFKDPRTDEEEILDKKRFDIYWIDKRKGENKGGRNPNLVLEMDSWSWAGQYQQDPVPLEGGMAKLEWFEKSYYDDDPMEIYEKAHKVYMSWDMNFKDNEEAKGDTSYVVGTLWGKIGPNFYLIDMYRAQIGFNATLKAFQKMVTDYPKAQEKLVEDRANGTAIMATLKNKIPGIIPVDTKNDPKTVRYGSVLWLIEAGNVRLPNPETQSKHIAQWVKVVIDELCRFPKAMRDDIVDSITHGLVRFQEIMIDPWAVPTGVGEGNRFGDPARWSPEDTQHLDINSLDVVRDWGGRRR
jgi:predicted phage terminase large subunit-like protein